MRCCSAGAEGEQEGFPGRLSEGESGYRGLLKEVDKFGSDAAEMGFDQGNKMVKMNCKNIWMAVHRAGGREESQGGGTELSH